MSALSHGPFFSRQHFGHKAVNLDKVRRWGLPVPETLVLGTPALQEFLDASGLREAIRAWLAAFPRASQRERQTAFEQLRARVIDAPLPSGVSGETIEELLNRSPSGLAARSSALGEDGHEASFAGVFESRLGLQSVAEVEVAIREIWASLWSPAALGYMERLQITPDPDGMAVMIQPMMAAQFAGVIYTAAPESGNPFQVEIHWVPGLSADLMDGSGAGAMQVLDWKTRETITSRPAQSSPRQKDFDRLCDMALELDDRFSCRLEIEWVLVGDDIFIVQARPLTGLPEYFPVTLSEEDANKTFVVPTFVIPLRKDTAPNFITPLYDHFDEQELWFRYHPSDVHFAGYRWEPRDFNGHRFCLLGPDNTFLQSFQDDWSRLKPWLDANEPRYRERWDNHTEEIHDIVARAATGISETHDAQSLIPVWIDVADRVMDLISFGWSAPQAMGWMFEALFRVVMTGAGIPYRLSELMGGSDTSVSYHFARDLQQFGRNVDDPEAIRILMEDPLAGVLERLQSTVPNGAFMQGLNRLCWQYGKFPPAWINRPGFWSGFSFDDPDSLLAILHAIRQERLGKQQDVEQIRQAARTRTTEYRHYLKSRLDEVDPSLAADFNKMVEDASVWTQALNDRHLVRACWYAEKEIVWQLGQRLVNQGLLDRPEDILCLRIEDMQAIQQLDDVSRFREILLERKAVYDTHRRFTPPRELGAALQEAAAAGEDLTSELSGTGMSGDAIEGTARHVKNLHDPRFLDSLRGDNILILPEEHAFFYADWHSIFMTVAGVLSPGRPSHHLTQVARECRIPVIGYVKGNLQQIQDGARVYMNPEDGSIRVLDRS